MWSYCEEWRWEWWHCDEDGRKGWRKKITEDREMYYEFGKMGQSVVYNGLFVVCVKHLPFHNEVNLLM